MLYRTLSKHFSFSLAGSSALLLFSALHLASCGGDGAQTPDPLSPDVSLAYVKRTIPTDDDGNIIDSNILDPDAFSIQGAALFIRDRGNRSSSERNITDSAFASGSIYDVKDLSVSYDGNKLLFAMRGPLDPDENDDENQPSWNLWEYNNTNRALSPIITSTIVAEEGHDIQPYYLPDGRIIFSSTRQVRSKAILLDDGKGGFSATTNNEAIFNLHVIDPINDPGGNDIQQITFNQGHDLQPTLLNDGRVVFLRHDNNERNNSLSLYTINSDGSNLSLLYGYHSQRTGNSNNILTSFVDINVQSDDTLVTILQHRESSTLGGDLIEIDVDNFTEIDQATIPNSGDPNPGQRSISIGTVNLDNSISNHGFFNSAHPFRDGSGNLLVSWSPCRLQNPNDNSILACSQENLSNPILTNAPPYFGLWTYDPINGTQTPIAVPNSGQMFSEAVMLEPKFLPPISAAQSINTELATQGLAELHIETIYDLDGTDTSTVGINALADPAQTNGTERSARFLRLIKAVSIPDTDTLDFNQNVAFGLDGNRRQMREILGYVPIEPDGSVKAQVPAQVAFYFDVVNADGERISSLHRNWLHLKPGETYECRGCHEANSTIPHGRLAAQNDSINTPGAFGVGTHFINTLYQNVSFTDSDGITTYINDGDSMAEVRSLAMRTNDDPGSRLPSAGLEYTDDWTDPTVRAPDATLTITYTGMATPTPQSSTCESPWQSSCRIIINYPDHIQPLWSLSRPDGPDNNQCTSCHTRTDAMSNLQEPAGQLELTNQPSSDEPLHFRSYRSLLNGNNRPLILNPDGDAFLLLYVLDIVDTVQQVYLDLNDNPILDVNGNPIPEVRLYDPNIDDLADIRIQSFTGNVVDVYLDGLNDPILDANGNPIEITVAVDPTTLPPGNAVMNTSNSAGSRFFDKLNGINLPDTISPTDHTDFMNEKELRLLREWLDIGGQYYNNPYDAPLN